MNIIGNSWDTVLSAEYTLPYFAQLRQKVNDEYATRAVFPPKDKIFSALQYVPYEKVKVVILGQDPYHEQGQANGMAFAVNSGVQLPPSLQNIFKEIETDIGKKPSGSTLTGWAEQGVLLLNTTLTVREGSAQSHSQFGWQIFTDAIIRECNKIERPIVFILWGSNAIAKAPLIDPRHFVIKSAHPSPLSAYRGFFGSKPFSKANAFLRNCGREPIDWLKVDSDKVKENAMRAKNDDRSEARAQAKERTDALASYYNTSHNIFRA